MIVTREKNETKISYAHHWIMGCNHKRLGLMYLGLGFFGGMLGLVLSVGIRLELMWPGSKFLRGDHAQYNNIITIHGLALVFYFIIFLKQSLVHCKNLKTSNSTF